MALRLKTQDTNGIADMRKVLETYVYGTGRFMEIPTAELFIDPLYQRDHTDAGAEKLINAIATRFDANKFEAPTVNLRPDGVKAVVDGGHRVNGAFRIGMQTITCRVIEIDPADEPSLYTQLNRDRRWVSPVQTFKAELAARNPAAIEIARVLAKNGLRVAASRTPTTVSCTKTLHSIYSSGGSLALDRVIRTARGWSEDEPRRFAGALLQGLHIFFETHPNSDEGRLVDRLTRITTGMLLAKASQRWHAWKSLDSRGGSQVEAIAEEIKKQYDKR